MARALHALLGGLFLLSAGSAPAALIEVAQESAANAGDFDVNILGSIVTIDETGTVADHYDYGGGADSSSYDGPVSLTSDRTHTFFVQASDGLHLVVVHDRPGETDGSSRGRVEMEASLVGDTADFTVKDDPFDGYAVTAGGTLFTAVQGWEACCTDGFAIGALEPGWTLYLWFRVAPSGIDSWVATGDPSGSSVTTIATSTDPIVVGRRVRFRIAEAVPEPQVSALLATGLIVVGYARRNSRSVSR